jgi:hypothetical protein
MQIKVDKIIDNPDGSATIHIDLDQEAMKAMASYGVLQALLNSVSDVEFEEVKE